MSLDLRINIACLPKGGISRPDECFDQCFDHYFELDAKFERPHWERKYRLSGFSGKQKVSEGLRPAKTSLRFIERQISQLIW